jgi:hypothetical protein
MKAYMGNRHVAPLILGVGVEDQAAAVLFPEGIPLYTEQEARWAPEPVYHLLTPWGRVLLEKLTGFAASQEIPRIYGTRKFITVFTSVRHLSLS